jgi:protein subunit release factor A
MLRTEMAIEWHGSNDGDVIEETVHFADGSTLEMRLELPEPEVDENEEIIEIDYVLVGGDEKNPILVHKDILEDYIECASEEELKNMIVPKEENDDNTKE